MENIYKLSHAHKAPVLLTELRATYPASHRTLTIEADEAENANGSFDAIVTYGVSARAAKIDIVKNNDGDRNFDKRDSVTNTLKVSHELSLRTGNYDLFGHIYSHGF